MRGWMSRSDRAMAWGLIVLALFGCFCGGYLFVTHSNGGDYFWLGTGILAFNAYWVGRMLLLLWEDRFG